MTYDREPRIGAAGSASLAPPPPPPKLLLILPLPQPLLLPLLLLPLLLLAAIAAWNCCTSLFRVWGGRRETCSGHADSGIPLRSPRNDDATISGSGGIPGRSHSKDFRP